MFYALLDRGEFPNAYCVGSAMRVPQSDVDACKTRNLYSREKDAEAR